MQAPDGHSAARTKKSHKLTGETAQRAKNAAASGKSIAPPGPPAAPAKAAGKAKAPQRATGRNPFSGDKRAAPVSAPPAGPVPRIPAAPAIAPAAVQLRHWRIDTGSTVKDWPYTQAHAETFAAPGIQNWTSSDVPTSEPQ